MTTPKTETDTKDKPIAADSPTGNPGEKRRPQKHRSFWEKWRAVSINNKLIVVLAGLTTGATVIYSVFAGWQLYEIHSGAKDTHALAVDADTQATKMTDISAAAQGMVIQDQRIADNAQESLDAAIAASRLDQRAWVGVTTISDISAPKAGEPEVVIPTIMKQGYIDIPYSFIVKNTGKTPAKHLRIGSSTSFGVDPNDPPVANRGVLYPGVLFPDQTSERYPGKPIRLDMKEWNEWVFGQKFVYVYVYIEYSDIFPGTKVHHTWMCSKFENFGKQTFCHIGNDGD